MASTIPLSLGRVAVVDDDDYPYLSRFSWYCDGTYAVRTGVHKGVRYAVKMHRVILHAPGTREVDHINGDTLDNRKDNLRLVTHGQNMQNVHGSRADSSTGARNVFQMDNGRYRVRMTVNHQDYDGGYYDTREEADRAARELRAELMPFSPEALEAR